MTKRNYKSSRLGTIAHAYGITLPTLWINLRMCIDRLPEGHPDRAILGRKGKCIRMPADVAVFVRHLGDPEIPSLIYEEKNEQ